MVTNMKLEFPKTSLVDNDELTVKTEQLITDDFLDTLSDERLMSTKPAGDFHRFASIPMAVIDKWAREGFNVLSGQHTAHEILMKLQSEDLGAFITTNKRL